MSMTTPATTSIRVTTKVLLPLIYWFISLCQLHVHSKVNVQLHAESEIQRPVKLITIDEHPKAGDRTNPYLFLTVSPNPAARFVFVRLYGLYSTDEDNLILSIYNCNGILLKQVTKYLREEHAVEIEVDCRALPTGSHLLTATLGSFTLTSKFIIVR